MWTIPLNMSWQMPVPLQSSNGMMTCASFMRLKYLGWHRTRNFIRGPGFLGTLEDLLQTLQSDVKQGTRFKMA